MKLTQIIMCIILLSVFTLSKDGYSQGERTLFLQELGVLAEKRSLNFIAILPQEQPNPLSPLSQQASSSWIDAADLFAIRWNVTYRVQDDYLLIGSQYAQGTKNDSVLFPRTLGIVTEFVQSLTVPQLQSLQQDKSGAKYLSLSTLTPLQREQLNKVISRVGSKKIVVAPEDKGQLWFLLSSGASLYSNGKHVGWLVTSQGEATLSYENSENNTPNAGVKKPQMTTDPSKVETAINSSDNTLSVATFVRCAIEEQSPEAEIKMEESVENSKDSIYVSSKSIPLNVSMEFIRESLDLDIRELDNLRYITSKGTLPNRKVEEQNAFLAQQTFPRIALALDALRADKPLLSQTVPEVLKSPRAFFRVELSSQTRARLKKLNSQIDLVISQYPKVAIGGHWSILSLVLVQEKQGIRKTSIELASLVSPKPLDSLAFATSAQSHINAQ